MKGTVKFYNPRKGFGFIIGEDGKEYFVHMSGLQEGVKLFDNDKVEFDLKETERGPNAVNVHQSQDGAEEAPAAEETQEEAEE